MVIMTLAHTHLDIQAPEYVSLSCLFHLGHIGTQWCNLDKVIIRINMEVMWLIDHFNHWYAENIFADSDIISDIKQIKVWQYWKYWFYENLDKLG